ncbi:hypothetical protein M885DRAFT_10470 [Pelagophyceae sp. CCMP2097]|nr:hypothetical protein M885DRAFT_10470 [Pelagophyceae sp. CCMP2097]
MRALPGAVRRRCVVAWLERGALEKVRYFEDAPRPCGADAECVEGFIAALATAAHRGEDVQGLVDRALADGVFDTVQAGAADEAELLRVMWLLARAGKRDDAATLAEKRGAHWRAAVLRGGAPWALGSSDSGGAGKQPRAAALRGNVRRTLWREACRARALAARGVALACADHRADIEAAVSKASRAKQSVRRRVRGKPDGMAE